MMKLGYTLLLFASILSLQCSTRPPSFYMVARHPELLDVKSSRLQLVIRNSGGASYSNEFLAWRARIIGYDRTDVISASILGPFFDAEENPAGGRPLFLADGMFRNQIQHSFSLPSAEASIFIRLFRQRRLPSTWWRDSFVEDDEFLAMHLYLEPPETLSAAKENERPARRQPLCRASFWKLHNPVRSIVHCNLESPATEKRIVIELHQGSSDAPEVLLNGQPASGEPTNGSPGGP